MRHPPENNLSGLLKSSVEKPDLAAAHPSKKGELKEPVKLAVLSTKSSPKKLVDKAPVVTAKALTKPVRVATVDPLAPLPGHHSGHSKGIATKR